MKLVSKKNWVRGLIAASLALAGTLASEGEASAFGAHFGGELGAGTRSHHGWGPVIGAHFDFNLIEGLYVGAYVNDMLVYPDNQPDANEKRASFLALGGRVKYAYTVIPKLRPYLSVGLGYVYAENPGFAVQTTVIQGQNDSTNIGRIEAKSGNFLELPVTIGASYEVFKHTELDLGLAWRPGFSFGGDAYEGTNHLPKPGAGFSATVGLSFFF